jgi:small subunit ribosomal protein S7
MMVETEQVKEVEEKQVEETVEEAGEGFKLFDMYSVEGIEIKDPALRNYINLDPRLLVKSQGRHREKFGKTKVNILERVANRIAVAGHVGKKHKIITSWSSGNYTGNMNIVLEALKIIGEKTKENPIQVLVTAVEKSGPRDEITIIEHAGARYPQSVDCSPYRRIDLAVRWITQGAYGKSFGKKKKMYESLANEIMLASQDNMESFALSKKNESEKQADSAR